MLPLRKHALSRVPRLSRSLATPVGSSSFPPAPQKSFSAITPPYSHLLEQLTKVRSVLNNRPLSLAEKIVYSHLVDVEEGLAGGDPIRGEKHLKLRPDRVALQGACDEFPPRGERDPHELTPPPPPRSQMRRRRWPSSSSRRAAASRPPCPSRSTATTSSRRTRAQRPTSRCVFSSFLSPASFARAVSVAGCQS